MPAKKAKKSSKGKKKDDLMTKTSVRIGKALARSTFKAEEAGRKAKKKVKEIIDTTSSETGEKIKTAVKAVKTTGKANTSAAFLKLKKGLSVEANLDALGKEIQTYLKEMGKAKTDKLLNILVRRGNNKVAIYAALGRLSQKGKITFSAKGTSVSLK